MTLDPTIWEYALTFAIGVAGSLISAMVGAGGGAITAPYLIFIGLPPQIGVATSKFGAVGVTLGAFQRFRKTAHIRWDFVWKLLLVNLPAAYVGTRILLATSNEIIEIVVGAALLLTIPVLFWNRALGIMSTATSALKQAIGLGLDFIVGSFTAAFGSGIGTLSLPIYMYFFGLSALETNATSKIPGIAKSTIVLAIVIASNLVDMRHGLALFGGSLVGGYLGAHIAVRQGNVFVKAALAVVLLVFGLKLLVF